MAEHKHVSVEWDGGTNGTSFAFVLPISARKTLSRRRRRRLGQQRKEEEASESLLFGGAAKAAGGGLHAKRVISFLEDLLATSPYFFRHVHRVARQDWDWDGEHEANVYYYRAKFGFVPFARVVQVIDIFVCFYNQEAVFPWEFLSNYPVRTSTADTKWSA